VRLLVLTDDQVGPAMAGSALRAWELAGALLRGGHQVRLAAAAGSKSPAEVGPAVVTRPPWRWADAIVSSPWHLPPRAFVGLSTALIVDGTTPLLAELAAMAPTPLVLRRRRTARARLPLVLARADAVLAAGPAQAAWWRERLELCGRADVPIMELPFGIPDDDPPDEVGEIPGVAKGSKAVLWWGGVWPWLDLETLLAARARLGAVPISLVVPVAPRPGGGPAVSEGDLLARAARYGLEPPAIVPLRHWTPYQERHLLLRRADLLAVLHHPGEEAELSFRTRAMDGVWAGVPLLVSEGGAVADLVRSNSWGGVVPVHDPRAAAAAIEALLLDREQMRCRGAQLRSRDDWRWSRLAEELLEALPRLPVASRGGRVVPALEAALALLGRAPGADRLSRARASEPGENR